jgi:hypothetical protein
VYFIFVSNWIALIWFFEYFGVFEIHVKTLSWCWLVLMMDFVPLLSYNMFFQSTYIDILQHCRTMHWILLD